ncbi:hypothetical protein [Alkalibacillus salilacus]|nr:hypothetical protein [Alkalibacillus salilacus]
MWYVRSFCLTEYMTGDDILRSLAGIMSSLAGKSHSLAGIAPQLAGIVPSLAGIASMLDGNHLRLAGKMPGRKQSNPLIDKIST